MDRAIRLVAFVSLVSGIGILLVSLVTRERANASGFVPGVGVGYALVTAAGLAFVAARNVRGRDYIRAWVATAMALWVGASVYLVIWGLAPGALSDIPMGTIIGLVILAGFFGAELGAVYVLFLIPVFFALAWLLDRVPALRRRGIGAQVRQAIRRPPSSR
jgi:hypothetical protein